MSVVVLEVQVTDKDLEIIKEDYGDYVKLVVDVEREVIAAGGEWHSDAEKMLLESGSLQKDLWGGGIDLVSGQVDYVSLINTRPGVNDSQEVSDQEIRKKMLVVMRKIFSKYVK